MPLEKTIRDEILQYCDRDLASDTQVMQMFDFIDNERLKERVISEYKAARYIYKLGEALSVESDKLHPHVKFQIVQYASIYEALIVYFLWEKYPDHDAVTSIEFHTTFRKAAAMPSSIQLLTSAGEDITLCIEARQKTSRVSIKFDDKVDAAVKIGFLDGELGEEIKSLYKLRNAIHLESALKNDVQYELASSQLAFRRMLPFTRGLRAFLNNGKLPASARLKKTEVKDALTGNQNTPGA